MILTTIFLSAITISLISKSYKLRPIEIKIKSNNRAKF